MTKAKSSGGAKRKKVILHELRRLNAIPEDRILLGVLPLVRAHKAGLRRELAQLER